MNALARLILRRKAELELTWDQIGQRGGFSSHTIVHALATKKEHRQVPRLETLQKLAKALDVPLEVVKVAAADAAGFQFTDVTTSLDAATDVRIVAAGMTELSDRDRKKIVALTKALLDDRRADEA